MPTYNISLAKDIDAKLRTIMVRRGITDPLEALRVCVDETFQRDQKEKGE